MCYVHSLRKESARGIHVVAVMCPFIEEGKHERYTSIHVK